MIYNKEEFEEKLKDWEDKLEKHRLPKWEELPVFELYMDQVIVLVNQYLSILEMGEERVLTPSMINNYVKQKTMPPPIKKRYSRVHVAYLIMICMLKQSLSISMIQKILPVDEVGDDVSGIYNMFTDIQKDKFSDVTQRAKKLYEAEDFSDKLVMEFAISASIYNILAEKLGK